MRIPETVRHLAASVVLSTALAAVCIGTAHAQQRAPARKDTLSAKARDSIIAEILADTLEGNVAADANAPAFPSRFRQSLTIRPIARRYKVGSVDAAEEASYTSYVARFSRATLRVDFTPVAYSGDTALTGTRPQVSFNGGSPLNARLDLRVRGSDTIRVFAQTQSFPGALSTRDAQALGATGTSTIDLDAGALGAAARIGTWYTHAQRVGEDGLSFTVRGGLEYDPKPSGTQVVSWRGTTVRGALGVNRVLDNASVGASVELTRSFADSLGGRNLFPGGGAVTVEGRALRFLGDEGTAFLSANAFYSRPIGLERADQPTRLIPIGDFLGVTGSGAFPIGTFTLLPLVSVLRESSSASALVGTTTTQLSASGYTGSLSLGLAIPVGKWLTLTPEVGGAFGSVGQTVTSTFPTRFRRPLVRSQSFTDPIRGRWVALEVSLSR